MDERYATSNQGNMGGALPNEQPTSERGKDNPLQVMVEQFKQAGGIAWIMTKPDPNWMINGSRIGDLQRDIPKLRIDPANNAVDTPFCTIGIVGVDSGDQLHDPLGGIYTSIDKAMNAPGFPKEVQAAWRAVVYQGNALNQQSSQAQSTHVIYSSNMHPEFSTTTRGSAGALIQAHFAYPSSLGPQFDFGRNIEVLDPFFQALYPGLFGRTGRDAIGIKRPIKQEIAMLQVTDEDITTYRSFGKDDVDGRHRFAKKLVNRCVLTRLVNPIGEVTDAGPVANKNRYLANPTTSR